MEQEIKDALAAMLAPEQIFYDEPLKKHAYFKIGGPADVLVMPNTVQKVAEVYRFFMAHQVPVTFIGNGSNILFSDLGIRGAVIKIAENLSDITAEGTTIKVQAGALLSKVSNVAVAHSLTGFEFASGIPGTIGGAAFMNAGAYGGEMSQVTTSVTVLTPEGEIKTLPKESLDFRYRGSSIQDNGYIALEVEIELSRGNLEDIKAQIEDLRIKRTTKQPLHLPSAGSTFKRPEGHFAGKLIQDAGLRGIRYKDAAVSELHCGFVVNLGHATAHDVLTLIQIIQKTVYDTFEVTLEPEVRMIGEGF